MQMMCVELRTCLPLKSSNFIILRISMHPELFFHKFIFNFLTTQFVHIRIGDPSGIDTQFFAAALLEVLILR